MFKESLHRLHDGSWLAITLDTSAEHEPPRRDIDLAYATLYRPNGEERDLLLSISLPIAADEEAAKEQDRMADGQRELVKQAKGTKLEAMYRDQMLRFTAQGEALRKPSRLLPRWVFPCTGTRVLCGFHVHRHPVRLRLVDVETEVELWSTDGASILAQIAGETPREPKHADPANELDRLTRDLDFESLSETEAQELQQKIEALTERQQEQAIARAAPLRLRPLAAAENRLLLDAGMERLLVSCEAGSFHQLARWPALYGGWPVAACTADGFVFHSVTGIDERYEVRHVCARDGTTLDLWPSKGRRVLCGAAGSMPPGDTVALAALGGKVVLQQTGVDTAQVLPDVLSLDKYDPMDLGIAPSGSVVAMCRSYHASALVLFDRTRGLTATVDWSGFDRQPSNGMHPDRIPGFAVTDDALLTLVSGQLSRLPLSELDWRAPSKPPPPIKRRRTATLTLESALKQGPLAEIANLVRSWFRPGVVLVPKRLRGDRAPIGASKSGGHPDLAAGSPWPRYRGTPMAFMLQIDLADVATMEPETGLPKDGLLSVFLAYDDDFPAPSFYSDANSDPDGCRIVYTKSSATLERSEPPSDLPDESYEGKDVVCAYSVRSGGVMLPELSNDRIQRANLTPQQRQAYRELIIAINGDDQTPAHWSTRLGGYPALLQNDDLHLQAETNARALPMSDSTYGQWAEPEFQQSAQAWRQLLQLAEGKEGWTWGDAGLMHIMVRDDQWTSATFTSAWGIGVCH